MGQTKPKDGTGLPDDENSKNTDGLDKSSRDFLESAIEDYNAMFKTNYDTSADRFQNYYKDVSLRMKNREIDLLIVVNMFLTGFDATTLKHPLGGQEPEDARSDSGVQPDEPYPEQHQDLWQYRLFPQPAKASGCGNFAVWR